MLIHISRDFLFEIVNLGKSFENFDQNVEKKSQKSQNNHFFAFDSQSLKQKGT